jgi:uncharacterized protein (TIGR03435 family)
MRPGPNRFEATGMLWSGMLLGSLSAAVKRPVVDKTWLTGQCDVTIAWTTLTTSQPNQAAQLTDSTSVFVAVEEQLGLSFVSAEAPVEVLVTESIDRPRPN